MRDPVGCLIIAPPKARKKMGPEPLMLSEMSLMIKVYNINEKRPAMRVITE